MKPGSFFVAMFASIALGISISPVKADTALGWFLSPISGSTDHHIATGSAWHGRFMVLAWALLIPAAVVVARYFKITPQQRWPAQLDNKFWFKTHRVIGYAVAAITTFAALLVILSRGAISLGSIHACLGWLVLLLSWVQVVATLFRGTHGGPIDPHTRQKRPVEQWPGDHFLMTGRRVVFEYLHKTLGYSLVALSVAAVLAGLREVDAPRWMWLAITSWWLGVVIAVVVLQRRVGCIDTYQGIWGLDPSLPGLQREPIGFGVARFDETNAGAAPWQKGSGSQPIF